MTTTGRILSIQTKITVFIVLVVVSVLSITTYVSRSLTEQKAEENLRERYINIVKQIDSSIVTVQELRDAETLQAELSKLLQVRSNIMMVEIFDLTSQEISLISQKGSERDISNSPPDSSEIEAIRQSEVLSLMEKRGDERFWQILAPILIQKEVAGLIRARISTREFDTLVSQERHQAFMATAAAALTILIFLVWYLRRTISKPIQTLISAMVQAESGNLNSEVQVRTADELGKLAEQFNHMLGKIRNFNDDLTIKVRQATEDLNRQFEELTRVNRRLTEAQLQLAHYERLAVAGQAVAAIAHQIGTPLHSILGHLHRLKGDTSAQRREERLRIIQSQVERVVQIIKEFLDTVRKPVLRMERLQVNRLLDELLNLVMPNISLRGINVKKEFDPKLPYIEGDVNQLHEAFLNLFTNAMDAMPAGGELKITTGLEEIESGGIKWINIYVSDSGCGIPEADMGRIFDPFFTTKEKTKGTGLGLSISRDIIKAHQGDIFVNSQIGKGTTFRITLPEKSHEKV